ncbi:rhamnose mutarotase [Pluteus cervinus]|uniref:Rhamnose mutarotase n=1 Tax=Pluteus cervinus TaxID=181527 RepID=A0ACD2ZYC0_9AGAR|nr:rhamnose mutarotase [Pluteus cervinus]
MPPTNPKRVCQIIKLKPESEAEYRALHAAAWPGVLAALERAHIVDYSIHYHQPLRLLVAHFKYIGDDYEADMRKMGEDPETRRWWDITDGMQESFVEGAQGSGSSVPWWKDLEEVFRFDGEV